MLTYYAFLLMMGEVMASQLTHVPTFERFSKRAMFGIREGLDEMVLDDQWLKLLKADYGEHWISTLNVTVRTRNDSCARDIKTIVRGLMKLEKWALAWADASGKPQPGVTGGAVIWPGSYELCLQLSGNSQNTSFQGRYCSLFYPYGTPQSR
ncbi:hypothetical protein CLF_111319, partial [Clonorchis sinensis]